MTGISPAKVEAMLARLRSETEAASRTETADMLEALAARLAEVEALKAQEAWEAEIILNADWSRGTVLLRQEDHDALIEVQDKRNVALVDLKRAQL